MKQWQEAIYKVYTEAKQFEAGKYHPRFGKTAQEFRSQGASVPSRDAMIFISNLLEYVGIFTEDETDSVVKNFNASERRLRFLELLDVHSEEIKSSAADIDEQYGSQFEKFFKVESANRGQRGRGEKYSGNAAAIQMAKQQKEELQKLKSMASGGAADALNVLSAGLDEAEYEMFGSLKSSFEDLTTIIEIKLDNAGFANKVVNFLKPFAGDSEIEVYGDTVEFSAGPDSQIAQLVAKIGQEKVEDTINDWLDDNTTGGITIITTPDEPGAAESMVTPRAKRVVMDDPEDTNEEPEYDSALPPTPVMGDDEDRYYPRSSMRPSFTDDDEDDGDSDYTPRWAREEEESSEDPVCDECDGRGGKDYPFQGEMEYDVCRQCDGSGKSRFSKYSKDDDESFSSRRLGYGAEDEEEDWEREGRRHAASFRPDYPDIDEDRNKEESMESALKQKEGKKKEREENNEDIKMSPQQMNQWMYNQRTSRMQNNLKQNERWSNY